MPYNQILNISAGDAVNSIDLISGGKNRIVSGSRGGLLTLWNAETGQLLIRRDREEYESSIKSLALSPNGSLIACGNSDGNIQLWSAETLQLIRTIYADNLSINSVAWSPDGTRIVSGSSDGHTTIWNASNGEKVRTLGEETEEMGSEEPEEGILAVAWRPNGQDIESSAANSTTYSWGVDAEPWEELLSTGNSENGVDVMAIAYNSDGSRIVKGESNGDLYSQNPETGNNLIQMVGHTSSVLSVVWSRDNKLIVSGSADNTVRIWNAATGENLAVLEGHTEKVTSVAISPDNNYIFSGSWDRSIKVWENSIFSASKKLNKALTKKTIGNALSVGLVRPPGHFGPTDPGGQEYQKAEKRWVDQGGLYGGKNKRINKRKTYVKKTNRKKTNKRIKRKRTRRNKNKN
jgi:WD40 repeat protein